MPIVKCGWTGEEMLINEPGGVAYITHADGMITCVAESKEEAIAAEAQPEQPVEETPPTEEVPTDGNNL